MDRGRLLETYDKKEKLICSQINFFLNLYTLFENNQNKAWKFQLLTKKGKKRKETYYFLVECHTWSRKEHEGRENKEKNTW